MTFFRISGSLGKERGNSLPGITSHEPMLSQHASPKITSSRSRLATPRALFGSSLRSMGLLDRRLFYPEGPLRAGQRSQDQDGGGDENRGHHRLDRRPAHQCNHIKDQVHQ